MNPGVKLYVCYGALKNVRTTGRPGGHPCGNAHVALKEAGHAPEVVAVHGLGIAPFNKTKGRKEVAEISGGSPWVPLLVTDSGEVIQDSKKIVAWAAENPAR